MILKILTALIMFVYNLNAFAMSDVAGSRDHNLINRFPQSYIVQYKQQNIRDYRLALGGLEKINGVLIAESEQRLSGELSRITYRIQNNHSPQEVFAFIKSQLISKQAKVLFECTGRACGSSNQWANNIFGYSRLYGIDSTQSYMAGRLEDHYFVVYTVQRGNKRVYARLDILQPTVTLPLEEKAHFILTPGDAGKEKLVLFIQENPNKRIWLVGYNFSAPNKQAQLDRSSESLKELESFLLSKGVDPERFALHPVGSFVPNSQKSEEDSIIVYSEGN